jgi:transposase InsO family protein
VGRPASALDNAAIESFHSTLEFELLSGEHFAARAGARIRVAARIDEYNTTRRQSSTGMIPPVTFETGPRPGRAA